MEWRRRRTLVVAEHQRSQRYYQRQGNALEEKRRTEHERSPLPKVVGPVGVFLAVMVVNAKTSLHMCSVG